MNREFTPHDFDRNSSNFPCFIAFRGIFTLKSKFTLPEIHALSLFCITSRDAQFTSDSEKFAARSTSDPNCKFFYYKSQPARLPQGAGRGPLFACISLLASAVTPCPVTTGGGRAGDMCRNTGIYSVCENSQNSRFPPPGGECGNISSVLVSWHRHSVGNTF